MQRLPKVKNKNAAQPWDQVTSQSLVAGLASGPGTQHSPGLPCFRQAMPSSLQNGLPDFSASDRAEFAAARSALKAQPAASNGCKLVRRHKDKKSTLSKGPPVPWRVRRKSLWPQKRLFCTAMSKENPNTCPMARLPQGMTRSFVDAVFSFL